mgnify:CR=1 FL=1
MLLEACAKDFTAPVIDQKIAPVHEIFCSAPAGTTYIAYTDEVERVLGIPIRAMEDRLVALAGEVAELREEKREATQRSQIISASGWAIAGLMFLYWVLFK